MFIYSAIGDEDDWYEYTERFDGTRRLQVNHKLTVYRNTEHCLQFTVISFTNYREFSQSALPLRCHSVSLVADDTSNPVARKIRVHI